MSEWISVEDKLPENGLYLIYFVDGDYSGWAVCDYLFMWITDDDSDILVTHWQPLPASPHKHPITPPKGESMPQTREYWEKRAAYDQELILEMKDEISTLKHTVNQLRQKANTKEDK